MIKLSKLLCILLAATFLWLCALTCFAEDMSSSNTNNIMFNGASQVDLVIAYARSELGSHKYNGYCQRFVRICYEAAGLESSEYIGSAKDAADHWLVSTSRDNIPVGAVLYFNTGVYGHSAIYLGNNRMIHALTRVVEQEISNGFWDLYIGWGWQSGIEPTGAYIDPLDVLTGDVYRTDERIVLYDAPYGNSISTISEGSAVSVRSVQVIDGESWARVNYYSESGYIRLKYCTYLYAAGGETETKSVWQDGVVAVTIDTLPDKYYYIEGEKIDASGLGIRLQYADGSSEIVDRGYEIITSNATGVGRETVLIRYRGALMWFHIVVCDSGEELAAFKLRSDSAKRSDELGCLVVYDDIRVSRISKLLKNVGNMTVYSVDGEQKSSGNLATGDYIVYDGSSSQSAIMVIRYGDLNGDGVVSLADTIGKKRFLQGLMSLDARIAELVDDSLLRVDLPLVFKKNAPFGTVTMPY